MILDTTYKVCTMRLTASGNTVYRQSILIGDLNEHCWGFEGAEELALVKN